MTQVEPDRLGRFQPWLEATLGQVLQSAKGHALLLHGQPGVGQFELAMAAAQAWLCEQTQFTDGQHSPACGLCPSCRLFDSHTHPDLMLLLPDAQRELLGWGGIDDGENLDKVSSAKASKDIKIEAVRRAVTFAQTTSSRGRAKVLVVHPAERLNDVAANALLKTLEEPPGQARFIVSSEAADALLPTIRSRCQALSVPIPDAATARLWLEQQGVVQPEVLLAATGGQPGDALAWSNEGITSHVWTSLPQQLCEGQGAVFTNWPTSRVVQTMQKLCHDAMRLRVHAPPRYFAAETWPSNLSLDAAALSDWSRQLQIQYRHAEHPWNQPLAVQALVNAARDALTCSASTTNKSLSKREVSPECTGVR